MGRYFRGVGKLAVASLAEAHRERPDLRVVTGHEGDDGRGVEAAGEKRAERHVAHHLQLDLLVQPRQELGDGVRLQLPGMLCTAIRGRPVTLLLELAAFPGRSRSRRQFADASEERL